MRIAIVCRVFTTQRRGGMPFVCHDRAIALARLGHEVLVLTTGPVGNNPACDSLPADDHEFSGTYVSVEHLPCEPMVYSAKFAEELQRRVAKYKPDILHLDSLDRDHLWWEQFLSSIHVTCTLHGFGYGSHLTEWNLFKTGNGPEPAYKPRALLAEMRALQKFHLVIATSLCEEWYLQDTYSLPHTRLVYNPIHEKYFTKPRSIYSGRKPRFLCAAITGRGTRQFDRAHAVARAVGAELVIAEKLSREEMVDLVDSCSCPVVPTCYAQGYDMVVPEAIARGRKVICAATGSYLREAQAGVPIITFPTGDWNALENIMRTVDCVSPVSHGAFERHKPAVHARNWLLAHGVL